MLYFCNWLFPVTPTCTRPEKLEGGMSSTLAPPCRIVNVMWYYVFHVSFTNRTGPEEFEGGMHTGPEELEGGMYGHSSIHSSFPPGPKAGSPVRLTVVPAWMLNR